MPAQVKVGEQFSAVLKLSSQVPLRGMPLMIGFDAQMLQSAGVVEGDYFKQGNGRTNFSQRVDQAQGKVLISVVRTPSSGSDGGVNGSAGLVTLNFKALKAGAAAKIQLLSVTPDPASAPVTLPVDALVRVSP
jgi:general secretion pathway protein D